MDVKADRVLRNYFQQHQERIESWFNIITPVSAPFAMLRFFDVFIQSGAVVDLRSLQGRRIAEYDDLVQPALLDEF